MNIKFLKAIIFCSLYCFFSLSHAEEQKADLDIGVGVYLDQDLFIPFTNEDRDYTMGVAVEFFWEKEKELYLFDGLVRSASRWVGIKDTDNKIVHSVILGTLAFTPDDLSNPDPIYDDRPYASLIYLGNKRVRADDKTAFAAELSIGLLGTAFAREFQSQFHEWYRKLDNSDEPVEPMGWDHQISDGGEITLRLRLSRSQLHKSISSDFFDVSTTYGLSLGFQTNASYSAALRVGNIKSPFWSLPYDPVNRGNFIPSKPQSEWYFWTAVRAHLVGYDALLQGQFRDSEVTYSSDEIERLVYDGAFGFTWGFANSQITFSANTKTSDLKHTDRKQTWGSVNYIYHF